MRCVKRGLLSRPPELAPGFLFGSALSIFVFLFLVLYVQYVLSSIFFAFANVQQKENKNKINKIKTGLKIEIK